MSPGQTGHITGQMGRVPGTDGTHTGWCPAKILYVYRFFSFPTKRGSGPNCRFEGPPTPMHLARGVGEEVGRGWGGNGWGLKGGFSNCSWGGPPKGSWGQTHIWGLSILVLTRQGAAPAKKTNTGSARGPKIHILKGFGASGRKIGAPQKRQTQPRQIQPPIFGPLIR